MTHVLLPSLIVFFRLCALLVSRVVPITEPVALRFDEQRSMLTRTPRNSGTVIRGIRCKLRHPTNSEDWNSLRKDSAEKSGATRIAVTATRTPISTRSYSIITQRGSWCRSVAATPCRRPAIRASAGASIRAGTSDR